MKDEWDEGAFQARVRARLEELGKSKTGALRDIDAGEDLLRREPKQGRRVDSLYKIARALDWTLVELLAIKPAVEARCDTQILEFAVRVAMERIPRRLFGGDNPAAVAEAAALAYDYLVERAAEGVALDSRDVAAGVAALVKHARDRRRRTSDQDDQG